MMVRIFLLLLTILPIGANLRADLWSNFKNVFVKEKPDEPSIRVLLLHDREKVHVEVEGKYSLYDPYKNSFLSTRFIGKARDMEAMSDGLKWGEAFPGIYQLQIQPEDKSTVSYIDRSEYTGPVYVYDIGNSISIINQVPIETYTTSILSSFDLSSIEREVIAALAIVARTNANFQVANPKTSYWAVDAQQTGYTGNPASSVNAFKADEAVRLTKNMVMSRTGVYEGLATPFIGEFGYVSPKLSEKAYTVSKITIEQANTMARSGAHAAQILAKAFPGTTIMLSR
jgi:stage II sporulation protein D